MSNVSDCSTPLTKTAIGEAQFPDVSNADFSAGPCHSHFEGDLGGLQVLATDSLGRTAILGGSKAVLGAVAPSAPPPPIDVTISKAVTGNAPAGATFDFQLECFGPDSTFSLADGESFTTTLPRNTKCTLTETNNGGATSVSGEFDGVLLTSDSSFTVTNTFPDIPGVLGTAISKRLTSGGPAAVGETVTFDIAVTFQGEEMRNVEIADTYEHVALSFVGASALGAAIDCQVLAGIPDAGHSMVVCPLGTATGGFSVQMQFTAVGGTAWGSTVNQASVLNDQDGPGGNAPTTTGPVSASVEIVEVLALAPLGDGPVGATSAWLQGLLVAIAATLLLSVRYATHHATPRSEG